MIGCVVHAQQPTEKLVNETTTMAVCLRLNKLEVTLRGKGVREQAGGRGGGGGGLGVQGYVP